MLRKLVLPVIIVAAAVAMGALGRGSPRGGWTALGPGLDLGRFESGHSGPGGDGTVVVLRVSPERWKMDVFCAAAESSGRSLTAREWCEARGLVAATNAGMFATDRLTHVGYLRAGDHVNSPRLNAYQSLALFSPSRPGLPRFRIVDLDASPPPVDSLRREYRHLVQNLRLVKRPRQNRWGEQEARWSEAALGEDPQGRALLVFSRTAYSMREFNEILLALPIDLVCAQHLEGGPEAQLYVHVGDFEMEAVGGYETAFDESGRNGRAWPIPNVIGISAP